MPWPPSHERLLEVLAQNERHVASTAESIERQQRSIAQLEAAGRGKSETAETLRRLLTTMQKAHEFYIRDRRRIHRLIATSNRDV
jgi:GAF domain-containing protein